MNTWRSNIKEVNGILSVEMCDGTFIEIDKKYSSLKKGPLVAGIRAEDIEVVDSESEGSASAIVNLVEPLGRDNLLDCQCGNRTIEVLSDPNKKIMPGEKIFLNIKKDAWQFFDLENEQSLLWN